MIVGLRDLAKKYDIPVCCNRVGAMMGMFFTDGPVNNFADAKTSNLERFSPLLQRDAG